MKVNPLTRTGAVNPYHNQDAKAKELSHSKGKRRDQVEISSEAKQLLGASNESKIQRLKNEVSSGTYYVEAGKIAEKLLPYFK